MNTVRFGHYDSRLRGQLKKLEPDFKAVLRKEKMDQKHQPGIKDKFTEYYAPDTYRDPQHPEMRKQWRTDWLNENTSKDIYRAVSAEVADDGQGGHRLDIVSHAWQERKDGSHYARSQTRNSIPVEAFKTDPEQAMLDFKRSVFWARKQAFVWHDYDLKPFTSIQKKRYY